MVIVTPFIAYVAYQIITSLLKQIDGNREEMNAEPTTLTPGDSIMSREHIPLLPTWLYILIYSLIVCGGPFFISCVYIYAFWIFDYDWPWFFLQVGKGMLNGLFIILFNWFNGAILRDYFQIKANYTRKISHFTFFTLPYIVDANIGELDPIISNIFTFYNFQLWMLCTMIPTRRFLAKILSYFNIDKDGDSWWKYLNFGEYMLSAMERSEGNICKLL